MDDLLPCVKTRLFGEPLFFLCGIMWVYSGLIWETILGWKASLIDKSRRGLASRPLCLFWTVCKARSVAFRDEVLFLRRHETSFVFLL